MSVCGGVCVAEKSDHIMEEMDMTNEKETIVRLRDVGTDNIATDKNRNGDVGKDRLKTFVKHVSHFHLFEYLKR